MVGPVVLLRVRLRLLGLGSFGWLLMRTYVILGGMDVIRKFFDRFNKFDMMMSAAQPGRRS